MLHALHRNFLFFRGKRPQRQYRMNCGLGCFKLVRREWNDFTTEKNILSKLSNLATAFEGESL